MQTASNEPIEAPIACFEISSPILSWLDGCGFLGISPAKGERMLRAGQLPKPFKIGHRRFFARTDLEAFLDRCRRTGEGLAA